MGAALIDWLPATMTLASAMYFLAVMAACVKFRGRVRPASVAQPPVSILKPVRGLDPHFEQNLTAHLEQEYPRFEVLVGAADADDAALAVAAKAGVRTFVCGGNQSGNRKVAILEALLEHASYELLLVDDADIHPPAGWLAATVGALHAENVGLATCLYRSRPGPPLASKIDALWVSVDFPAQALTAAELGGIPFALGATMLFRRVDLERIGGFAAIRSYLADDYQIGTRIAGLGKDAVLSSSVVETAAGDASLGEIWRRHLRWSRTVRVSRPGGHLGLLFTFASVWSGILIAITGVGSHWVWLAAGCLVARCAAAVLVARTMGAALGSAWLLLPAADVWCFAVWVASFFGRTVTWRGRRLELDRQGRILPSL